MVAKRVSAAEMAAKLSEREFVELCRAYLARRWKGIRYAVIVGHTSHDVTDDVLRVIPPMPSGTSPGRAARPSRRLLRPS